MASAKRRSPKILVVDDDPDWRELVLFSLADMGYQADEARSGDEAVEKLHQTHYDILLLDLCMPGMPGEEVLKNLPDPPPRVVLMTSASATDAGGALGTGPWYYLPKDAGGAALSLIVESLQPH